MKKIYLILGFVFAIATITGTANATVKKCVPLVDGTQTSCAGDFNYSAACHADWRAGCTTNGVTTEQNLVKGIAACSNQSGVYADTSETITTSDNVNDNRFCWCKMTTPAVSLWVFAINRGNGGNCAYYCAHHCAEYIHTDVGAFRSALFSGMGE